MLLGLLQSPATGHRQGPFVSQNPQQKCWGFCFCSLLQPATGHRQGPLVRPKPSAEMLGALFLLRTQQVIAKGEEQRSEHALKRMSSRNERRAGRAAPRRWAGNYWLVPTATDAPTCSIFFYSSSSERFRNQGSEPFTGFPVTIHKPRIDMCEKPKSS